MNGSANRQSKQPQPPARGWFPDPWSDELLRRRDNGRWTDEVAMAPVRDAGKYRPYHPLWQGAPRSLALRAVALVALWCFAFACLALLNGWVWQPDPDDTSLLRPLTLLAVFVVWAVMAQQVDYRWFDALLILVPFYGWWWMGRITWRLTNLPYRDWSPRPEVLAADAHFATVRAEAQARRAAMPAVPGTH